MFLYASTSMNILIFYAVVAPVGDHKFDISHVHVHWGEWCYLILTSYVTEAVIETL